VLLKREGIMTIEVQIEKCCDEVTVQNAEEQGCCTPTVDKSVGEDCCQESSSGESADPCCGPATQEKLDSTPEGVKAQVRDKYASIAVSGSGCGCSDDSILIGDNYSVKDGYEVDADLQLGCGIPTDLADIREGHDVLDLGSGAGIDAFISRRQVGPRGSVTGVDFTAEMISLARENAEKLGYENVSFIQGDIESLPLQDSTFDRVISNCVINLVPDKKSVYSEIYRVLRPQGSFAISDIVIDGVLPDSVRHSAEMYAGCVSGATSREDYLQTVIDAGFEDVTVVKDRVINLPDSDLLQIASQEEIDLFRNSGASIRSITVSGLKA